MSLSIPVPVDQLANVGSTITIEELDATTPGGKPRRIVLIGGGLPFMGQAEWGGDSRVVTTWYPGNGVEASQQVLGPQEMPSQWQGEWNRTRMGRAPSYFVDESGTTAAVIDPHRLYLILDDLRVAQSRVRVTWSVRGRQVLGTNRGPLATDREVDFSIVREGRLKSLKINPDRLTDIKWTAEFHWMNRGARSDKVASVRRDEDLGLASSAVSRSIDALELQITAKKFASLNKIAKGASKLTLGQLESMANAPLLAVNKAMAKLRYNVNQFKRIGALANKLASLPNAMANSVLDFARDTNAIANHLVDSFGQMPTELLSTKQTVADTLRATKYFGQITNSATAVAKEASNLDLKLRQAIVAGHAQGTLTVKESATTRAGDLIAIHVCKFGDTPQRVSSKYFGNPDQGEAILRANRMPLHTPQFRQGLIIIIPALVNAPRT